VTDHLSGRIVVDPDELRRFASRLTEASVEYTSTARALAAIALPVMPLPVADRVIQAVARAADGLNRLADEMLQESGDLYRRAASAEWGEVGGATDRYWGREVAGAEGDRVDRDRWADELLDRMGAPLEPPDDDEVDPAVISSAASDEAAAIGSHELFTGEWAGSGEPSGGGPAAPTGVDPGVVHLLASDQDHPGLGLLACLRTGAMGGDDRG
jgi:hypothetical protein